MSGQTIRLSKELRAKNDEMKRVREMLRLSELQNHRLERQLVSKSAYTEMRGTQTLSLLDIVGPPDERVEMPPLDWCREF